VTSSPRMRGAISPDLSASHYHILGQNWSLITSCKQPKLDKVQSLKMHCNWLGLPFNRKPLAMQWKISTSNQSINQYSF